MGTVHRSTSELEELMRRFKTCAQPRAPTVLDQCRWEQYYVRNSMTRSLIYNYVRPLSADTSSCALHGVWLLGQRACLTACMQLPSFAVACASAAVHAQPGMQVTPALTASCRGPAMQRGGACTPAVCLPCQHSEG